MSVLTYFAIGIYSAGALFTFRFAGGRVAWAQTYSYPDGADIFVGFFAGLVAGLFWPIALAAFGVKDVVQANGSSLRELMAERVYRVPTDERDRTYRAKRQEAGR